MSRFSFVVSYLNSSALSDQLGRLLISGLFHQSAPDLNAVLKLRQIGRLENVVLFRWVFFALDVTAVPAVRTPTWAVCFQGNGR
jgi:hypothetical protein